MSEQTATADQTPAIDQPAEPTYVGKRIEKNLTAGGFVYRAVYFEMETPEQFPDVIRQNGLTLKQVNTAMRLARKEGYIALLEDSPEDKLAELMRILLATGSSEAEATAMVDAKRESMKLSALPSGVTPVLNADGSPKKDTRGRKSAK